MIDDFKVTEVVIKGGEESIVTYPFKNYVYNKNTELKHTIGDVEYTLELATGKPKSEWPTEIADAFNKIRKTLLNAANSISRLGSTATYKGRPFDKM